MEECRTKNKYPCHITATKSPDKDWMLAVLSTLNQNHKFFAKGYEPPKVVRQRQEKPKLSNEDNFFTGVPMRNSSKKRSLAKKKVIALEKAIRE